MDDVKPKFIWQGERVHIKQEPGFNDHTRPSETTNLGRLEGVQQTDPSHNEDTFPVILRAQTLTGPATASLAIGGDTIALEDQNGGRPVIIRNSCVINMPQGSNHVVIGERDISVSLDKREVEPPPGASRGKGEFNSESNWSELDDVSIHKRGQGPTAASGGKIELNTESSRSGLHGDSAGVGKGVQRPSLVGKRETGDFCSELQDDSGIVRSLNAASSWSGLHGDSASVDKNVQRPALGASVGKRETDDFWSELQDDASGRVGKMVDPILRASGGQRETECHWPGLQGDASSCVGKRELDSQPETCQVVREPEADRNWSELQDCASSVTKTEVTAAIYSPENLQTDEDTDDENYNSSDTEILSNLEDPQGDAISNEASTLQADETRPEDRSSDGNKKVSVIRVGRESEVPENGSLVGQPDDRSSSPKAWVLRNVAPAEEPVPKEPYKCKYCAETFTWRSRLDRHELTHTKKDLYRFNCSFCGRAFTQTSSLYRHERIHTGERPYKCEKCPKGFRSRSDLKTHESVHTGRKPYRCETCSKEFSWKGLLKKHELEHGDNAPYKCRYCDRGFTTESKLVSHERSHTGEKPFKCDECGLKVTTKHHLISHMKTHMRDKPYKCTLCDMTFIRKESLEGHAFVHGGKMPFQCKYCPKVFTRRNNFVLHERVHTGQRPHKCTICGKGFTRASILTTHMVVHDEHNHQQCAYCGETFRWRTALFRHEKTCSCLKTALENSDRETAKE